MAHDRIAPRKIIFFDSLEIHRGPLTCYCTLYRLIMGLDTANFRADALWEYFDFLIEVDRPGEKCSGDDRAEPFHGKDAIDGKTEETFR